MQAGIHLFVEKPLSVKPAAEVLQLSRRLQQLQAEKGLVIAVGYKLRYSPAVEACPAVHAELDKQQPLKRWWPGVMFIYHMQ